MRNIVIIEDENGLRESLLEGLEGAIPRATFKAFGSVEEALGDIEAKPPCLVISDIQLPGQSGVDFLLLARQRWPTMRFILITAYATLLTHEKAHEYGAFRLLRKPFSLKDLVDAIHEALAVGSSNRVEEQALDKGELAQRQIPASKFQSSLESAHLSSLIEIDGFLCACLVDSLSGEVLGAEGNDSIDLDLAAAGNAKMILAERNTLEWLDLQDQIEDILITLKTQYHLFRLVGSRQELFLYLVLDRARANLALARHELQELGQWLESGGGLQRASPQQSLEG